MELYDPNGVVAIPPFAQTGLHGSDSASDDGFDAAGWAEEPEGEIDVVDAAVDEDAT